jgi:hypothetical protein
MGSPTPQLPRSALRDKDPPEAWKPTSASESRERLNEAVICLAGHAKSTYFFGEIVSDPFEGLAMRATCGRESESFGRATARMIEAELTKPQ